MGQAQRGWGKTQWGWRQIAASGQNVDDDRGGEDALIQRLLAGGFHSGDPVGGYAAEDRDHLFVAIADALQLAADRGHGGGQDPVTERGAIAQSTGFARQNRDIVPGIVDRLKPAKTSGMFCDDGVRHWP